MSIIQPSLGKEKTHIRYLNVGNLPTSATVSPVNKIIYTANSDYKTISFTNETSRRPLASSNI